MANWSLPTITSDYASVVVPEFRGRDEDAATMAEAPTNPPTGFKRWNVAAAKFQQWDGSSWVDLVLSVAGGGTGSNSAAGARTNLGLGTMAVQNDNAVAITGGVISGLTSLGASGNITGGGNLSISGLASIGGSLGVIGASTFGGALTITAAAPQVSLTNATSNYLLWNTAGVNPPTFTSRSAGTKLVLYPNVGPAAADFALGIEASTMWFSVASTGNLFKFYGGTTLAAQLTTLGLQLTGGGLFRPDGLGHAITLGNGANNLFGQQSFFDATGTVATGIIRDGSTSTVATLDVYNDFDEISLALGRGSTALYGPNQYSSAIRFNGSGVFWGDFAYFPNGGDLGEFGHFRFIRSGGAVVTSAPTASVGCGAIVVGDGGLGNPTIRWQSGNYGFYYNPVGSTGVIGGLMFGDGSAQVLGSGPNAILNWGGPVFLQTLPSIAGTDMVANGSQIGKKTSSRRYKENIVDVSPVVSMGVSSFLKMKPHEFDYKEGTKHVLGFIAEDAEEQGLTYLLNYNEKGEPESFRQDALLAYLFQAVKDLYAAKG